MISIRRRFCWFFSLLLVVASSSSVQADVKLPSVFGDNMVLQRGQPLKFWGKADPGENVTVSLWRKQGGDAVAREVVSKADDTGSWKLAVKPYHKAGPISVAIKGKNTINLKNVLIGEVWICSGQSNMEWQMKRAKNSEQEIAAAKYSNIRLFHVKKTPKSLPQDDVQLTASWKECSPDTVPNFSAVAYFFGRHLQKELDVPIGLIETAWGGSRIEPWTPPVGFKQVPKLQPLVKVAEEVRQGDPNSEINRQTPTVLYNGMVHGLVPFSMRGAIWYQGESNRADGMMYCEKMKGLIYGWRKVWNQGDFPFLFVQLAPYTYRDKDDTLLPKIWEAQTATLSVPNTGMAVTVDIGNVKNIHPTNKQDVGKRLALWALAKTYGNKDLVYSGPLYQSMSIEHGRIRIKFKHVGSGLLSRDSKPLSWFTIAGQDGKFVSAKAEIDGDSVVVSSDKVSKPKAVRFGWNQLAEPNLSNKEGLPASPFRTDH
jgi:sialate O-acetylesterase